MANVACIVCGGTIGPRASLFCCKECKADHYSGVGKLRRLMARQQRFCGCGEELVGRQRFCDSCIVRRRAEINREAVRRCHAKHAEKRAAYSRQWRSDNPDYHIKRNARIRNDAERNEAERQRVASNKAALLARDPEYFRRAGRKRRALARGAKSEPYSLAEIGDRDGWRCQLCGRKVNPQLAYPDPLSGSVDHIVPLSLGGDDLRRNVQLAHLTCNRRKHTRSLPGGEQLRLIG